MPHISAPTRHGLRALAAITLAAMLPLRSAAHAESHRDDVARVEAARLRAEVAKDMPRLETLVASDLWYIHANGRTQDRAAYLAMIAKGESPVYDARLVEEDIRLDRNLAVTHGTVDYLVRTDSRPRTARFVGVYRHAAGTWQLISWQNTAVADPK